MNSVGHSGHPPVHAHFQLVLGEHVLPHDDRQPGARIEAALRDVPRLQDGRPAHVLHFTDADQHEQTAND